MKTVYFAAVALILGWSLAAVAQSAFPNGDMSKGESTPEGWSLSWVPSGKMELVRDTTIYKGAPASLRLGSVGGPARGGAGHAIEIADSPFTISGWIRAEGTLKSAVVGVQAFAGGKQINWSNVVVLAGPTEWRQFSARIELPKEAQSAQCGVTLEGEGKVWVDEISLVPERPSPSKEAAGLPVAIPPQAPEVRYLGRWDTSPAAGPKCSWPASAAELRFQGAQLNVRLNEAGQDEYAVILDRPANEPEGGTITRLATRNGEHVYPIFAGAAGAHTVELCKRTEAFVGVTQVLGFEVNEGGHLLPLPPRLPHRLEVIGDSISCGYGNEAPGAKVHFTPQTENASETYGARAARAWHAEYTCIAWSGKKMAPDNTMGELYDRILPTDPKSRWDFSRWTPEAVVINLSTNDFGKAAPEEEAWVKAYEDFVRRVRKNYPAARILCTTSPMMWGERGEQARGYIQRVVKELNAAGDAKVAFLAIPTQDGADGIGADWHPSLKTHEKAGELLAKALQQP